MLARCFHALRASAQVAMAANGGVGRGRLMPVDADGCLLAYFEMLFCTKAKSVKVNVTAGATGLYPASVTAGFRRIAKRNR